MLNITLSRNKTKYKKREEIKDTDIGNLNTLSIEDSIDNLPYLISACLDCGYTIRIKECNSSVKINLMVSNLPLADKYDILCKILYRVDKRKIIGTNTINVDSLKLKSQLENIVIVDINKIGEDTYELYMRANKKGRV